MVCVCPSFLPSVLPFCPPSSSSHSETHSTHGKWFSGINDIWFLFLLFTLQYKDTRATRAVHAMAAPGNTRASFDFHKWRSCFMPMPSLLSSSLWPSAANGGYKTRHCTHFCQNLSCQPSWLRLNTRKYFTRVSTFVGDVATFLNITSSNYHNNGFSGATLCTDYERVALCVNVLASGEKYQVSSWTGENSKWG